MPSFLSIPQTADQASETAGAVTSGFEAGEKENKEAADRAETAKETEESNAATATANAAKTQAAIAEKRVGRAEKLNADNYKDTSTDLATKISAQQALLNDPHADKTTPEYKQVAADLAHNQSALQNLSAEHTNFESNNDDGRIETFDPKYASAPNAPAQIPLDATGQLLQKSAEDEKIYGGALKKKEFYDKENAAAKPTKIPAHLQTDADTFSGAQSLLNVKAQRVADLENAVKNNPNDEVGARALAAAREDLQKTRDNAQSSYSRVVNGMASGGFGEDVRSAYAQLAGGLPQGTDPSDIANQGKFRAALQAKNGALSPAEQTINGLLRGDQDVSANWNGGYVPPDQQIDPMQVKAAIDNETGTLGKNPSTPMMPAPAAAPVAPAQVTAGPYYTTPSGVALPAINPNAPPRPFTPSAPLVPVTPTAPPLWPVTNGGQP